MIFPRAAWIYRFSGKSRPLTSRWRKSLYYWIPGCNWPARVGDADLSWTIEALPGHPGTRAILTLPEPIQDAQRILRLRALARLTLDRPCRLPRMRPEGLFWQEGSSTLIVPDPLVIERLLPINCSQRAVGPLDEPRIGETLQFQNYSPDATIELTLARRRPSVHLITGTAVEIGDAQMTARIGVNLSSDDPARFMLEADVSKSWIIDSVESVPAELLADWSLEGQPGTPRKLLIRLSKAPPASQPLRLAINARRLRTFLTRQWDAGDLLPLRFTTPAEDKRLAAIQAADSYQLKLVNREQLARLNARDLASVEKDLFAAVPTGLLFEDNAGAAGWEIALQAKKPAFSTAVLVEARVSKNRLQETCLLRCVPESAGIERVIVQLSRLGDVPPLWTLGSEDNDQLSVRQWSKEEQAAAGLGAAGETWELTFHRPRSAAFEIHGTWEAAFSGAQAVCLASLPEAGIQHGTLAILGSAADALHIENRRLKSIPSQPAERDQYSTVQAIFRFDPLHDVVSTSEPALILSSAGKENGRRPGFGTGAWNHGMEVKPVRGIWPPSMCKTTAPAG